MSCNGNYAFYIVQPVFFINKLFFIKGAPLNNLACARNILRAQGLIINHLTSPPPTDSFDVIFLFFDSIYIHEYANIGPLVEWTCQIVSLITDDITTRNNDNIRLKSTCLSFLMMFPYFLTFFSNLHEIANFANNIICMSDHEIKDM